MSFIGNKPDGFNYATTSYDHFNGDGSTTVYTLTRAVSSNSDIFVTVNNVPQDPGVAYYVNDLYSLVFTGAPSSGSGNITVTYRQYVQAGLAPAANTVTTSSIAANTIQFWQLSSGLLSPLVDVFTANGATATFTLQQSPISANSCTVTVNGLLQTSPANYSTNSNILTFTSNPANGSVVRCQQGSLTGTGVTPLDGSVTNSKLASNLTLTGTTKITDNGVNAALTVTQTGAGNAFVVEDSANPDSTPFVIDAIGTVLVGTTTAQTIDGITPAYQQLGSGNYAGMWLGRYSANATANYLYLTKSRGTVGTNTIVNSGDDLGTLAFYGADGTNLIQAASVLGEVDGTPGTNDMPGRLVFSTTADGASGSTERMRISSTGQVIFAIADMTAASPSAFYVNTTAKAAQTGSTTNILSAINTDSTFISTGTVLRNFYATQGTFAVAPITQIGFYAHSNLTGATNNFGFQGVLASATGAYNLYMSGTANNYMAGSLGIGTTTLTNVNLRLAKTITGSSSAYGMYSDGTVQSDVTSSRNFTSAISTQAAAFTLGSLSHYQAIQGTTGASSIISSLFGYVAESNITSGTNNYGYYANIASPTTGITTTGTISTISSSTTTVTVNHNAITYTNGQTVTISATANATALTSGATCTILTVGTTDFTAIGAASNTVGVSFTATGVGTGTGTVTLNVQGSGKTVAGAASGSFTYTTTTSQTFAAITVLTGSVTVSTRYNLYMGGTASNYFAGNLLVGHTSAEATVNYNNFGITPLLEVHGNSASASSAGLYNWSPSSSSSSTLAFSKSVSGTVGTNGVVALNADLGNITFSGDDGTNFISAVAILAEVDGTVSANVVPGRIIFSTTSASANTPTERMRIDSAGDVGIGTTAPLTPLNVNGTGGELIRISVTPDTGVIQEPALGFATGVTNTYPATKISALEFDASDSRASMLFYTRGTNSDVTPTERMRIDSDGNVGVNNASPAVLSSTTQIAIKANVSADSMFVAQNSNGLTTAKFGFQFTGSVDNPVIGSQTNHPLLFLTNNTERMRINAGAPILCLSGGSTTATGTGIAFPATQSASTDANTLDDYEEGTWTPSVTFGGGSTGQTGTFSGFYTKTGNQVFATALINLTNKGSSTGTMAVAGLPFTSISSNANYRAMSSSMNWDTLASSYVYMYGLLSSGATSMEILAITAASASNSTNPTQTNLNNTSAFRISITYQTP